MAKKDPTGWTGWVVFASFVMILLGFVQALVGLTAIFKDTFFVTTQNYLITYDPTSWGWVHLIISLIIIAAGFAVLSGKVWGRTVGVVIALLSAIANFAFIPYYPIWSIVIIIIDILVIYALIVHGDELEE